MIFSRPLVCFVRLLVVVFVVVVVVVVVWVYMVFFCIFFNGMRTKLSKALVQKYQDSAPSPLTF